MIEQWAKTIIKINVVRLDLSDVNVCYKIILTMETGNKIKSIEMEQKI